jgi:hypothetical protein
VSWQADKDIPEGEITAVEPGVISEPEAPAAEEPILLETAEAVAVELVSEPVRVIGGRLSPTRWFPALTGVGTLGALLVGVQAATATVVPPPQFVLAPGAIPQPAGEVFTEAFPTLPPELLPNPGLIGPPAPAAPTVAGPGGLKGPSTMIASGRLPGVIGFLGPINGPLNTDLSGIGPVRGPMYRGAPLPGIGSLGPIFDAPAADSTRPGAPEASGPPAPGGDVGSELPDPQKLAMARLANPSQTPIRIVPRSQPETGVVSAEKPLGVSLIVRRPAKGYEPGASVPFRIAATADAHLILIGVDGEGRASVVFRSPGPARSVSSQMRAQGPSGPQYLLAFASVNPLTGADVAAALRAHGVGFISPMVTVANQEAQPGAAWSAATGLASGLGGGSKGWPRYEWALSAVSFATVAPPKVAAKPSPDKPAPDKVPEKPAPGEGSALPTAPPAGEKSVMPTVKPEAAPAKGGAGTDAQPSP